MLWAAMTVNVSPTVMFLLISFGTVLGIAGTDLVLPAIPAMPTALGGTAALAQMVLAAYAGGTLVGLLTFGELGARYSRRKLLVWSLGLFAVTSLLSAYAPTLEWLVILRFAQGAFGSGPAVFAPGFIHGLYPGDKAPSMFGRLGSIESLTPALAPIAGAYLMTVGGWQTSFLMLAGLAILCAVGSWAYRQSLPDRLEALEVHQSYMSIIRNGDFLRHGLSQALSLGSILIFVFGAPAVMTGALGMTIGDFILLQVFGIALFILASNASNALARRFGDRTHDHDWYRKSGSWLPPDPSLHIAWRTQFDRARAPVDDGQRRVWDPGTNRLPSGNSCLKRRSFTRRRIGRCRYTWDHCRRYGRRRAFHQRRLVAASLGE